MVNLWMSKSSYMRSSDKNNPGGVIRVITASCKMEKKRNLCCLQKEEARLILLYLSCNILHTRPSVSVLCRAAGPEAIRALSLSLSTHSSLSPECSSVHPGDTSWDPSCRPLLWLSWKRRRGWGVYFRHCMLFTQIMLKGVSEEVRDAHSYLTTERTVGI